RAPIAVLAGCLLMAQAPAASPDDLIARGRASYAAGRFADAAKDLSAAADAIVTPAQMQQYVTGGKFDQLPKFETAIIYLAMSYARLGRDAEAREQIQRLVAAETIAPVYARLRLDPGVAGFEDLVRRLSPAAPLASRSRPRPPVQTAIVPTPSPHPQTTSTRTPDQRRQRDQHIATARA